MTKSSSWDPEAWSENVRIHAYLMMAAWGFFLPVGLMTQSHLRNRPNWKQRTFGNHFHMSSMTIGVILALVGFWYGYSHLTTFTRNPKYVTSYAMAHAVIGTIVTALMVIEVLLVGLIRTIQSDDDKYEDWPMWRKMGHAAHRRLGFIVLILAFVALEMGTHISSVSGRGIDESLSTKDQEYSICLMATYLATIIVVFGMIRLATKKYPDDSGDTQSESIRITRDLSELSPLLPY